MGWLRLLGSLEWKVSFVEYGFFYRALLLAETCNFKEPTNRRHPISSAALVCHIALQGRINCVANAFIFSFSMIEACSACTPGSFDSHIWRFAWWNNYFTWVSFSSRLEVSFSRSFRLLDSKLFFWVFKSDSSNFLLVARSVLISAHLMTLSAHVMTQDAHLMTQDVFPVSAKIWIRSQLVLANSKSRPCPNQRQKKKWLFDLNTNLLHNGTKIWKHFLGKNIHHVLKCFVLIFKAIPTKFQERE